MLKCTRTLIIEEEIWKRLQKFLESLGVTWSRGPYGDLPRGKFFPNRQEYSFWGDPQAREEIEVILRELVRENLIVRFEFL